MTTPNVYLNFTPSITTGGLTALQLALASYLVDGNSPPLFPNENFLTEMKTFADSSPLSPATVDLQTGNPREPDIAPGLTGIAYVSIGDDIYLIRHAQDCGPDEVNRYEKIYVGNKAQVAEGSFAYYGGPIENGSTAQGSGSWQLVFNPATGFNNLQYIEYEREDPPQGDD